MSAEEDRERGKKRTYRADQPDEEIADLAEEFWAWAKREPLAPQWITAIATCALVVLTFSAALIYGCQLQKMSEADSIGDRNLTSVQRAFVSSDPSLGFERLAPPDIKTGEANNLLFHVRLANYGNTPTLKLRFYCHAEALHQILSSDYSFHDFEPDRGYPADLPPKGNILCFSDENVSSDNFKDIYVPAKKTNIYVWGWRDI